MVRMAITQAERNKIKSLVKEGLSGSKIAERLHLRKSDVLAERRKILGIGKQKFRITVKGKGSQTKARKSKQERDNLKSIKRIKQFNQPKAQIYAILTTKRKFIYPNKSNNRTNTIYLKITDKGDLERARDRRIDLFDEGLEPILSFVDLDKNRKVSEKYVEKQVSY